MVKDEDRRDRGEMMAEGGAGGKPLLSQKEDKSRNGDSLKMLTGYGIPTTTTTNSPAKTLTHKANCTDLYNSRDLRS